MKYKSPKQHNSVVQTMLEEAIKKIIKTKHESDVNMLTNVLDYHQKINDKEIKRRFYEDFKQMQQELPVIHVDSDLLRIITKHITEYGFALTHGPDGEYMSTALLHKAGYKVSTEVKNGLNAKRTNVINMLSLVIQDENLTEVEEDSYNEETPSLATQFIAAIGYAAKYGETKDYKFGVWQYTLEQAYENSLDMHEHGSVKYTDCIQAYEWEFYEDVFKNAIEKALKDGSGIKHRFGMAKDTIEDVYKDMVRRQDEGSDECDTCIQAYREAFINNKE